MRALINVGRKRSALRAMQQSSALRERACSHVPQQQRAGTLQSHDKGRGRGSKNSERPASASSAQHSF
jgi:hypothetical protein